MTGWLAVLMVVVAAANPASLAGPGGFDRRRLAGTAGGLVAVALVALLADPIVDALSVSNPTFRTAAGAVVGMGGAVEILRRRSGPDHPPPGTIPGVLATLQPPVWFAAVAATIDDGWGATAIALAVSLAATIAVATAPRWVIASLRIGLGALAVGAGVLLVSSGIRAV